MASRRQVRAPTTAPVPDSIRVPSTTKGLLKNLGRLSKNSLIDLAMTWLREENLGSCQPYLASNRTLDEDKEEDYLWVPAETTTDLQCTYNWMKTDGKVYKRHVVDRILDGDWRRGLSLYQLATIDIQHLAENDKAMRWTALKVVPYITEDGERPLKKQRMDPAPYSDLHPATFVRNLQNGVAPLVKGHYTTHRLPSHPDLAIVRICVAESPYANPRASESTNLYADPFRLIYLALPTSCPYLYVSVSGYNNGAPGAIKQKPSISSQRISALKRAVLEEIPKALGKSHHRYSLAPTHLTARSLTAVKSFRGNTGTNGAHGFYSVFSKNVVDNSPVDAEDLSFAQKIMAACIDEEQSANDGILAQDGDRAALSEKTTNALLARKKSEDTKRLKVAAAARFGMTGITERPKVALQDSPAEDALDRFQIRLDEDLIQGRASSVMTKTQQRQPNGQLTLTLSGSHVFLGLRKLTELGLVDAEKMPPWMTGEEAVSGGVVKDGVILNGQGSGL